MSHAANRLHTLAALLLGLMTIVGAAQATTPDGLSNDDWQAIVGQINESREARQYTAAAGEDGFAADNPAHGFSIRYRDDGSTELSTGAHRISLRPRALGYGDALDGALFAIPEAREVSGNTVATRWNEQLREWCVNAPAGLEQWFELARDRQCRAPHVLGENCGRLAIPSSRTRRRSARG